MGGLCNDARFLRPPGGSGKVVYIGSEGKICNKKNDVDSSCTVRLTVDADMLPSYEMHVLTCETTRSSRRQAVLVHYPLVCEPAHGKAIQADL